MARTHGRLLRLERDAAPELPTLLLVLGEDNRTVADARDEWGRRRQEYAGMTPAEVMARWPDLPDYLVLGGVDLDACLGLKRGA